MSIESMGTVLNSANLPALDKLILLGIANHDGDGGAWPSVATLARYGCCSTRTVQRVLHRLSEAGYVTVQYQRGGTIATRVDRRPNLYTVNLAKVVDNAGDGVTEGSPRVSDGVTDTAERGDRAVSPEPSLNSMYTNKLDSYVSSLPAMCVTVGCERVASEGRPRCSVHTSVGSKRGTRMVGDMSGSVS